MRIGYNFHSRVLVVTLAAALAMQTSCAAESSSDTYTQEDPEAIVIALPIVVVGGLFFLLVAGGLLVANQGNVEKAAAAAADLMQLPTLEEAHATIANSSLLGYLFTRDYIQIGEATVTSVPQLIQVVTSNDLSPAEKIVLVHQVAQDMVAAIDPNVDYAQMLAILTSLADMLYQMGFHEILTLQALEASTAQQAHACNGTQSYKRLGGGREVLWYCNCSDGSGKKCEYGQTYGIPSDRNFGDACTCRDAK